MLEILDRHLRARMVRTYIKRFTKFLCVLMRNQWLSVDWGFFSLSRYQKPK